jgi:hypothetical protein
MPDDDFEAALTRAGLGNGPPSTRAGQSGGTRNDPTDDFDAALQRAGIAGGQHQEATASERADLETNAVPGVNSSPVQPAEYQRHDADWADTLADSAIGLGEGVLRGVGINPARAAGFLAERGAQAAQFLGANTGMPVSASRYGVHAEEAARGLMQDAHSRSPMAVGMAEAGGEMLPGLAAMAATGGAVNPVTLGVVTGGLSGLGNSESTDFRGVASDVGEGALFGGLAGGTSQLLGKASQFAGGVGRRVTDWADEIADSPMTKKAAHWAGLGAGGSIGGSLGGLVGPGAATAGAGIGGAYGAELAERAAPGAVRAVGSAIGGFGQGVGEVGASRPAQSFAAEAVTQQYGRSNLSQERSEDATDQGRGNLLGEAALAALQHDPQVLGSYAGEFARAAASPDTGAVNALISKLAMKDSKFRTGPMVELQKMTAGF